MFPCSGQSQNLRNFSWKRTAGSVPHWPQESSLSFLLQLSHNRGSEASVSSLEVKKVSEAPRNSAAQLPASQRYLKWHRGIPSLEGVRAGHSQAFDKRKIWRFSYSSWSGYGVQVGPGVSVMTVATNLPGFQKSRWSDMDSSAGKHFKV